MVSGAGSIRQLQPPNGTCIQAPSGGPMEPSSTKRKTVEQLAEEFVARYRRGERPALTEYTERYPEHAEQIRDLFPALVLMEQIAPESSSDPAASSRTSLQPQTIEHPKPLGDYRLVH